MSFGSTIKPQVNFYGHQGTQNLLDNLVAESIRMYGQDMQYVPRRRDTFDDILQEDDTSYYDKAYGLPAYVKTAEGFMGQEAFMTNFGLEIRPQAVFSVARIQFENNVKSAEEALNRPREGDLMFFPINNRVFEIKYVDDKPFFYQGGELQLYDLTVELFEYSGERFSTGIIEIDSIQDKFSIDTNAGFGANQDTYDPLNMNDEIQDDTPTIIEFDANNPWADGNY